MIGAPRDAGARTWQRPAARGTIRPHDRVGRAASHDPRRLPALHRGRDQAQPRAARARRPAPLRHRRKMVKTFGLDEVARARFAAQIAREKAGRPRGERRPQPGDGDTVAMQLIPIIELCRWCPGMVTAMGVSAGLTPAAILARGTIAQKERWALPL